MSNSNNLAITNNEAQHAHRHSDRPRSRRRRRRADLALDGVVETMAVGKLATRQARSLKHAHHLFSFARSSSKKLCTTTRVGVPAMSAQLLSRTMRNR